MSSDPPPPPRVCASERAIPPLAPRAHEGRRRAQALLFLLALLPFAAHGQPAAPTGLTATPGDSSATLTWTDPSDSSITGYSYRYATSVAAFTSGSPPAWTTVAGGGSSTSQTVPSLTNGTRYYFRLRATSAGGDSPVAHATIQLAASPSAAVTISDGNLRTALEGALGKGAGATITQLEMATLTSLRSDRSSISVLTGINHAVNLTTLRLGFNSIMDVSSLGTLVGLTSLDLWNNEISDVSALGTLTSLATLELNNNSISDVAALGTLTSLTTLGLRENSITDVSPLGALTSLLILRLAGNSITDVTALGTLTSLRRLGLSANSIADVTALGTLTSLTRLGLGANSINDLSPLLLLTSLTDLNVTNNPLCGWTIDTHISALEARGVDVRFDPTRVNCPAPPALTNSAPEAAGDIAEMALGVGETRVLDLSGTFVDPDGDELTYLAWSSDESVATAWVFGSQLRVRGEGVGVVDVQVRATDPGGLSTTQRLRATVGAALSLPADGEVPEGQTVRLAVTLSTPRDTATTFGWRVAADDDPATADADAGEHGGASGELTIPAGETTTEIAIAIADDDDIEPAREWFDVLLDAPADGCCALRQPRARVAVLEGVCDRTPAVADALRGDEPCTAPTPAALAGRTRLAVAGAGTLRTGDFSGLAGLRWLSLSGNGLAALPEGLFVGLGALRELNLAGNALTTLPPTPFQALPRLRILDLSANGFETLPAGLFAGLSLREASLEDNPGAPFALAAELVRADAAEPWAPGPATLEARLPSGAPFSLRLPLTAEPTADGLPVMLDIPAGATNGEAFAVSAPSAGALVLRVGAATPPAATCGAEWPFRACFRGLTPEPSATLTLFRQPPRALPVPQPEALAGDDLRLPLASLVTVGDAPGTLRWQASSSDESVATVRVVGGELVVEPELATEGVAEIVLVATDSVGLAATVRFEVQVEFFAPARQSTGWRSALPRSAAVSNQLLTED